MASARVVAGVVWCADVEYVRVGGGQVQVEVTAMFVTVVKGMTTGSWLPATLAVV